MKVVFLIAHSERVGLNVEFGTASIALITRCRQHRKKKNFSVKEIS